MDKEGWISKSIPKDFYQSEYFYDWKIKLYFRTFENFKEINSSFEEMISKVKIYLNIISKKFGENNELIKGLKVTLNLYEYASSFSKNFAIEFEKDSKLKKFELIKNTIMLEIISKLLFNIIKILESNLKKYNKDNEDKNTKSLWNGKSLQTDANLIHTIHIYLNNRERYNINALKDYFKFIYPDFNNIRIRR